MGKRTLKPDKPAPDLDDLDALDDDDLDRENTADDGDDDGWCIECGDPFHYDDCGGYNPPCVCGAHCRACHEAEQARDDADRDEDDAFDDEDEP